MKLYISNKVENQCIDISGDFVVLLSSDLVSKFIFRITPDVSQNNVLKILSVFDGCDCAFSIHPEQPSEDRCTGFTIDNVGVALSLDGKFYMIGENFRWA